MEPIVLLATAPAILALVNLAKQLGLPSKASMVLAIILGVAMNVADYYLATYGAYQAATTGLILGLSAAGLYDIARKA